MNLIRPLVQISPSAHGCQLLHWEILPQVFSDFDIPVFSLVPVSRHNDIIGKYAQSEVHSCDHVVDNVQNIDLCERPELLSPLFETHSLNDVVLALFWKGMLNFEVYLL